MIFQGFKNPPTLAGVRRFRLNKPDPASLGGLPPLPPGVHRGNRNGSKIALLGFIFGIKF